MPEISRIKNESFKLPDLMKWFLIYLNVTVLLFFFGPIHYNPRNPGIVVFYLILYHVCLWSGYRYANVRCNFSRESFVRSEDIEIKELKIIKRLIVFGIFVTVMLILRISDTFNPNEIINKVIQGFINPAKRYGEQIEISSSGNLAKGNLFSFLITLGLPFCIVAMVLSVYYFTHLSVGYKLLTICLFALRIASDLISGTNEGIFDVAIYIGVALFLKHQNANLYRKTEHRKKRGNIIMIIAIVLLVYGALSFFTKNIIGRTKGNLAFSTLGENYYDPDRHILKYIPKEILVTFAYLSVYLCEGYYGFSLSTTIEWVPNFGLGFSSFIRNNLSSLFGYDLFQYSYQYRIDEIYDWGARRNYYTAYTFWANDVSRIGVTFIMFILGYVFCKCYYAAVVKCSKTSIVLMPLLMTMLFYLPANNKILAQPASFLLIAYICLYKCFIHLKKGRFGRAD